MIFCKNCDNTSFNIFEQGTIFCIKCFRIYKVEKDEKGIKIIDTGLIK